MKFFKPEDFGTFLSPKICAEAANAKLEREGVLLYSNNKGNVWERGQHVDDVVSGLLINIETLEACGHPKERLLTEFSHDYREIVYSCTCGAKLKPVKFEVIK